MKLKKAAILSLSFLTIMATDIVAPLIGQVSTSFPDVHPTLIKQSITLPSLLAVFFGLIAGQLVKVISKKAVLAIALVLYTIGGLAAGWTKNFTNHLILRGVLGAGTGMIIPVVTSLIADYFEGKERIDMVGYSFAASHFGAVVTPPLAAIVGAQDWRNAFFIYAIAPVVLVFSMIFITNPAKRKETRNSNQKSNKIPPMVYWLSFASISLIIFFFIIITDIPFLTAAKPQLAGYVTTFGLGISTLGSTLSGFFFSPIYAKLKKWTTPSGALITALGFLLTTYTQNSIIALIGLHLAGVGIGLIFSLVTLLTVNSTGKQDSTSALAFLNSAFSVGMFSSPFFYAIVPGMLTKQPDIIYKFQLASFFFLIVGILSVPGVLIINNRKSTKARAS